MPRPAPGSRWFCKFNRTGVAEVAPDRRFTKTIRYYLLNDPRRRRDQSLRALSLEDFHESYQQQPRYPVEWINEGSVWRRLSDQHPIAVNCVVVAGINESGYVRIRPITTEGLGEPRGDGNGVWMGGLTVFNFMRNYARVWGDPHGLGPDEADDPNECYPLVLYRNQLMTPELPGQSLDEEIQGALGRPRSRRQRRDLVTQHNADSIRVAEDRRILARMAALPQLGDGPFDAAFREARFDPSPQPKKKRKKRRKKTAKAEPVRRSALDRLLDEDF